METATTSAAAKAATAPQEPLLRRSRRVAGPVRRLRTAESGPAPTVDPLPRAPARVEGHRRRLVTGASPPPGAPARPVGVEGGQAHHVPLPQGQVVLVGEVAGQVLGVGIGQRLDQEAPMLAQPPRARGRRRRFRVLHRPGPDAAAADQDGRQRGQRRPATEQGEQPDQQRPPAGRRVEHDGGPVAVDQIGLDLLVGPPLGDLLGHGRPHGDRGRGAGLGHREVFAARAAERRIRWPRRARAAVGGDELRIRCPRPGPAPARRRGRSTARTGVTGGARSRAVPAGLGPGHQLVEPSAVAPPDTEATTRPSGAIRNEDGAAGPRSPGRWSRRCRPWSARSPRSSDGRASPAECR